MTTADEHLNWIAEKANRVLLKFNEGLWSVMTILDDGHVIEVDNYTDLAECTREMCDELCLYLKEKCV